MTGTVQTSAATYSIAGSAGTSGATVTAGTKSATSDASGNYTITGLAAGTYTVTADEDRLHVLADLPLGDGRPERDREELHGDLRQRPARSSGSPTAASRP